MEISELGVFSFITMVIYVNSPTLQKEEKDIAQTRQLQQLQRPAEALANSGLLGGHP